MMGDDWISVNNQLPEAGEKVLATYLNRANKRKVVVGYYAPKLTIMCDSSGEWVSQANTEYCEIKDEYLICEGWYEQQDNSDYFEQYTLVLINEGKVDYWQPVPSTAGL